MNKYNADGTQRACEKCGYKECNCKSIIRKKSIKKHFNKKVANQTPNEKEIIFMEIVSDILEKNQQIDRTEALAQSCKILDELDNNGIKIQ